MKITSIRVEAFRRFRDAFTLDGLHEGINLVAAPNGCGKSTLAEAVRVAFQERHRTAALGESLAPWSQPGASPSVQVAFEHEGRHYRLAKTFGGRKSCTLEIDGATVTGDEAEQLLAGMFSFSYANKGASKEEHRGVPGLLWVRQGTAGAVIDQVGHAHEYLSRALGNEMGELAATAGDRVVERVAAELAVLHTKGGKPTGEYARDIDRLAAAQAEAARLDTAIAAYDAAVDRYTRLRQQQADAERDRPWLALRRQAEQAGQQLAGLERLAHEREQRRTAQQLAATEIDHATALLQAFDQEEQAVRTRRAESAQAAEREAPAARDLKAAEALLDAAAQADAAARTGLAAARRAAQRRTHAEAGEAARQALVVLQARIAQAEAHDAQRAAHRAEQSRLAGFAGARKRLQAADARRATAQARLDAVSTRLEYRLAGDTAVRLDGVALQGEGHRTIAEPVVIDIAGIGSIRVLPGAQDLSQLQAESARAAQALAEALQAMGAAQVEEAHRQEEAWERAGTALRHLDATLAGLAPQGLDGLRAEATRAEGEAGRHRQALEGLPPVGDDAAEPLSVDAAEAREDSTRAALKDAQQAAERARQIAGKAQETLRFALREAEAAQQKIDAPGREARRGAVAADRAAAQARAAQAQSQLAELDARLQAAQPTQLRQDIERWTRSAAALEAEHGRAGAEQQHLMGQLQAQGALGLQEEAATAREAVARLQRLVADRSRRAAALGHLLQVLGEKRAAVARSILAPLQRHMDRYLAIHMPGAGVVLDEALRPGRVVRSSAFGVETGGFLELSGGEREQIGIIARLAYADLLKEAGKPTLIMLDDSLVNSDFERLGQMKRVLYDASLRHQIIVFTCHEANWMDMGVAARRLG